MALLNDQVRAQLKKTLESLKEKVNILYFTQEIECGICFDTHEFLKEFCELSDKLTLTSFDFVKDSDKAEFYSIDKVPAIALLDSKDNDTRIRFYGLPAGYEINSFIMALFEISGVRTEVPADLLARIKKITKPVHLQVFVSLTCPYCPDAVHMAHRFALENPNIRADMVDSSIFTPLAIRFNVISVPKTIINDKVELTGLHPIESLVAEIEKL